MRERGREPGKERSAERRKLEYISKCLRGQKRAKPVPFSLQIVIDDLRGDEVLDGFSFVFFREAGEVLRFFSFFQRGVGGGVHPNQPDPREPRLPGAPPPISLLNLQFRAPRRVPPPPFPRPLPSPEKRVGVKSQGSWLCVCGSVVAAAAAAGQEQERRGRRRRRRRRWLDMNAASAPALHREPLLARGR